MQKEDTALLVVGEVENKEDFRDECDAIWSNLFDEYFKLKNNGKAVSSISKSKLNNDTRLKIVISQHSLEALNSLRYVKDLKVQTEAKIRIIDNLRKNIREYSRLRDMDSLEQTLEKAITIHEIMYRKYEMNNKRVDQEKEKEIHTIEKSLVDIQNVLGYHLGRPEEISVIMFIEYEKSALEKIKISQKNGKRNTRNT